MEVAGKRIVVTGSSCGLGRAFAITLAAEGAETYQLRLRF